MSLSAGRRYCQAHTGHNTERLSSAPELQGQKLAEVLNYETAVCYGFDAERAAIGLALAAGQVPNASEAQHFVDLQAHYSKRQQVQIVAVISLFGFLNRWNEHLRPRHKRYRLRNNTWRQTVGNCPSTERKPGNVWTLACQGRGRYRAVV